MSKLSSLIKVMPHGSLKLGVISESLIPLVDSSVSVNPKDDNDKLRMSIKM
jgi:hypothetical protein